MARIISARLLAVVIMLASLQLLLQLQLQSGADAAREEPQGAGAGVAAADRTRWRSVANYMPQGLCGYKSKTFSGQCVRRSSCAYQCQVVEHAAAGACHFHHVQRHCYCYRYCS